VAGAAEFAESCRRIDDCHDDDETDDDKKVRYEYPIQLGLKNGYQELVMRSPGRYELALLLEEDRYDDDNDTDSNDGQNISENNDNGGAQQHQVGAAATNDFTNARHEGMTTSAAALQKEDCCYNGKRLMTVDMIERAKRQFITANYNNCEREKNDWGEEMMTRCSVNETTTAVIAASSSSKRSSKSSCLPQSSCLQQLLRWIKQYETKSNDAVTKVNDRKHNNGSSINSENDDIDDTSNEMMHEEQTEENVDEMNFKSFMELVSAIFPPPAATNTTNTYTTSTTNCSHDNNHHPNNDEYYLCNLSLLISTPGSPTQSWHADGGHTSLTTHHPCHVFNVFIPLIDVPLSMGPTELRPGTHVYTRDLARMMLLAKAKKRLREAVVPELRRGDALLFDYRILHRGRANLSDGGVVGESKTNDDNDDEEEHFEEMSRDRDDDDGDGDDISTSNKCHNKSGRDRPVLVLTFARRWFVDVCNFPKRSIFSLQERNENGECQEGRGHDV